MKLVDIPHFKEVVIINTICDDYKSNEVKTSAVVPSKFKGTSQLSTQALTSPPVRNLRCNLTCPELYLELTWHFRRPLYNPQRPPNASPRQPALPDIRRPTQGITPTRWAARRRLLGNFLERLREVKSGKKKFICILDDPLAAAYV
ncbi:nucleolar zinc-finger protein [Rhizina undulata]